MLAMTHSATIIGIDAHPVQVEVNTGEDGEPKIVVVGLPDAAVKESTDRISSALVNSGYRRPAYHTTVNLAPGGLRKEGPSFDLPMALAMLEAMTFLPKGALEPYLVAGELSLSGRTRPVRGGLSMARQAKRLGKSGVLLPVETAREAALVNDVKVYAVSSLDQTVRFLRGDIVIEPLENVFEDSENGSDGEHELDFADVKGQHAVRRAVEVAVAGSHNFLMIGPPGSGKSMIAKRIPTIMPHLQEDEFLEILQIHSAAGKGIDPRGTASRTRPYRAPHHTISDVGLLGGGSIPGPGEISLAHNGVLFLDELPEFRRSVLEVLRQPMEDGEVTISRSAAKITLPCNFMLIAAMNPTPSGFAPGHEQSRDTPSQIERYRSKISGPLLDRIDIQVEAPALSLDELQSKRSGENSASMRERIEKARAVQATRFENAAGVRCNAAMGHRLLESYCALSAENQRILKHAMEQLKLSARAYDRIRKVARTIADLEGYAQIESPHLLEAIQYRSLDRDLL
ncbi:MAG: YifB family Mg chelatase-like AAA ATPase [Verrucomicrobiota bacterium]